MTMLKVPVMSKSGVGRYNCSESSRYQYQIADGLKDLSPSSCRLWGCRFVVYEAVKAVVGLPN